MSAASPKSKRTPPPNKFEDYILTYTVGQGLYPVSSAVMTYLSEVTGTGSPYSVGSEIIDIGFTFKFDGNEYKSIYVSTYGFAILLDPNGNPSNVILDIMNGIESENSKVKDGPWPVSHVILSPWWNKDTASIYRDTIEPPSVANYIANLGLNINNVNLGITPMPMGIDALHGGIKKFKGIDARDGNFFLLRWKVFPAKSSWLNVISYDIVLYESGILEFRYAPSLTAESDLLESSTAAIFASYRYPNRYRDFSYLMRRDSRGKYRNGGAVYDGSYTDTDNTAITANYTVSLSVKNDWPGLYRGATFRMTPPRIKRRQTRRNLNDRDSIPIIKNGMFNDQKTIIFSKNDVQFPAMLPIDYVTSMNDTDSISVVELYSSGSIEVKTELKTGIFDNVMIDSLAERGKK